MLPYIATLWLLAAVSWAKLVYPDDDPFYQPDVGYEQQPEGTILRMRPVPNPLRGLYVRIRVKNAWQMLVRSTDSQGFPIAIVTTLIQPHNADPKKVISYHFAQDSSTSIYAPSFVMQFGSVLVNNILMQCEMYLITAAMEKGYYIVAPDYEGPRSAFTVGRTSGHATLDSLRAILTSTNVTGLHADAKVCLWGYSGGSIPTLWATTLLKSYAPDLNKNMLGAAMGGVVSNLTNTAQVVEGGPFMGYAANAINGWVNEFPGLYDVAQVEVFPERLQEFISTRNLSAPAAAQHFKYKQFFLGPNRYFIRGWDVLDIPWINNILSHNTVGLSSDVGMPTIPVFIHQGRYDNLAPFGDCARVYDHWCKKGAESVEFTTSYGGHFAEAPGMASALAWMEAMFNGKVPLKGCSRTDRFTNALYPGTSAEIALILEGFAEALLQQQIGPSHAAMERVNKLLDGRDYMN